MLNEHTKIVTYVPRLIIAPIAEVELGFTPGALARRRRRRCVHRVADQGELQIKLRGNLAAMLGAAQNAKRSPETGDLSLQVQMVAGARNPLDLEFAWTVAHLAAAS